MLIQQKRDMEIAQQHEMDEAKIRFFTNVSHDLRTPLSLIITPLERIMSTNVSRDLKEDMELMHRNASILMDEVDQLLDFRKLDKQKASLAASYGNLSVFIEEISNTFHSLAAKNKLQLDIRIIEPDLEMNFDRNKLQRVILNLISNALKYNVPGGTVTVLVDKIMSASGSEARISVIDTGIGIKAENRDKIFDRFFQEEHTSTTYVGNGIGLHIVKEYVSLHGGSIEVMANEPSGSIFTITLPMDIKATTSIPSEIKITENESISENESLTRSHSDEKVNILIVEDNEDFRSFIINCLKDFYEVFDASNGVEALSVLENNDIKMVISDVMMPVMDGMELCQKIKNNIKYSHIPVILLTARTADEHILNGLQEGADDYITKPFNLKILLLRIRKLLEWSQNVHNKFKTIDLSPSEITVSNLDEKLI